MYTCIKRGLLKAFRLQPKMDESRAFIRKGGRVWREGRRRIIGRGGKVCMDGIVLRSRALD